MDTLFTGQNIIHLEEVASTNSYAMELLRKGRPPEGTVVSARKQSEGKGQRGNTWHSEAGSNLTISVVFYPAFLDPDDQFMLSRMASLALADTLRYMGGAEDKVQIKWPNDLLMNGKKIAGLLIENVIASNSIASTVIGIGLNVNQEAFGEEAPNATSLFQVTGKKHDLNECLGRLCTYLEARYLQLRNWNSMPMEDEYLKMLYRLNEWADYKVHGANTRAKIEGVTREGILLVTKESGERVTCDMKEIVYL